MAGTYSKYQNTPYYSLSSQLILVDGNTQSYSFGNDYVYKDIIDNTQKLIEPKKIRDAILSIWDSIPYKETNLTNSNIYYIGLDSTLNKKNFFGKREFNDIEIMNDTLLNSDVDTFFYNTKSDNKSQLSTKIRLLSGTNSAMLNSSPTITTNYVKGLTYSTMNMSINTNGDINISSRGRDFWTGLDTNSSGNVIINDIPFPTYEDNIENPLDSKILTWTGSYLTWSNIDVELTGYVGITGSELNLYGENVKLNGYSLDFTDDRWTPINIGDIKMGDSFSGESLVDILGKIIYKYQPPRCEIKVDGESYLEVGTDPKIFLNWRLYKITKKTKPTKFTNIIPSNYPPIIEENSLVVDGRSEGVVITPLQNTQSHFSIIMEEEDDRDENGVLISSGNIVSVTTSIWGIYPFFFGVSTASNINNKELKNLNKLVEPKSNKEYDFWGDGNLYFIYDSEYGPLTSILDSSNNNITGSFSMTTSVLSSPDGYWQSKEFNVYYMSSIGLIEPSEIFKFLF